MLGVFLKKITETSNYIDSREESYYPAFAELLKDYAESSQRENIHITTLPKKTDAGNPDFRVWDGKEHIVGYIEAKSPVIENLDVVEHSEQLKRYLNTFPNLILTNFFEFRLYRNGLLIDKVLIARPYVVQRLKTVPPVEKEREFLNLLEKFFSFSLPAVNDAKGLAVELAKRTRFLRDVIAQELQREQQSKKVFGPPLKGYITTFYEVFKRHLITDLNEEDFADLYSQTITYGLFAARTRSINGFNRKLAYDSIPKTIGILRDVFKFISLGDLPGQMEWIVDDISEVLAVTDVFKILDEFYHQHKGRDPVVHFYETFLAEYDPETREKRGVYYTPEPVVTYIVRAINHLLKEKFHKRDGLADTSVTVLDPAAGTLTFLSEAAKLAVNEFITRYGEGGKERFIKEHILRNFYAFELMMAPYAVGHLKISFLLEELGYRLCDEDRFNLYLTNTLEMKEVDQAELPGIISLSEESRKASQIKKESPILVIIGNPPYSGHSANKGEWISLKIKEYYTVDGKPLNEKNPKWLQDDYVKFIRFAQWKIDQMGEGIIGFITNHSYLDNPTFRGMRQSLLESFNEIYLLDLHGNSLKKEKCPDGTRDENVFDIQQGVAISLFVKKRGLKKKVLHADLWGIREAKYNWLREKDIRTTRWQRINPASEFYLFIPRDEGLLKQYERFHKITDIFLINSVGVVTSRDEFVIDFDKEALKRRIRMFTDEKMPDDLIRQTFKLRDTSKFYFKNVREALLKDNNWSEAITEILYRPFDIRYIFYHDLVIERSRKEVMRHMIQKNIGLITVRQVAEGNFNHVFVTQNIIESRITLSNKGIGFLFPLYLYHSKDINEHKRQKSRFTFDNVWMLFEPQAEYLVKRPNLSPKLLESLSKTYKKKISPEEVFFYIYAVLYSNIYRMKYAEFLKIDFPRIPFTKDYEIFKKMAVYGERLVLIHLLKSRELDKTLVRFQGKGNNRIERLRYEHEEVFINENQYFENVPFEVWNYHIGGYQVCEKWLKDRKDRMLELRDIQTYCRIITAISLTMKLQKEIDILYEAAERFVSSIE